MTGSKEKHMSETRPTSDSALDGEAPPGVPRWVKVFGIVALVLVVLFLGAHLVTGMGPGLHVPAGGH